MTRFDDKEIVKDPLDNLDGVHTPNIEREGPIVKTLHTLRQALSDSSYHNTDPTRGHLSTSDGCSRRSYLNYIHKLDPDLDVPPNDPSTNWTFTHGDLVHEEIQDMFLQTFGKKHVSVEETVKYVLDDNFDIYGHADIVLRGLDDPDTVYDHLPQGWDLIPESFNGFPDPFVIDIKTTAEFTYYSYPDSGHARSVPKENNLMQLNGYMGILDAQFGALLYYSKRNDHIEEYWIDFNPELFEQAKENIMLVLESVNKGEPAPRDADGAYMCEKFCKWYKQGLCPGIDEVNAPDNYDPEKADKSYEDPEWA